MLKLKSKLFGAFMRPFARCTICGALVVINVLHPLIHGTPLDSGMLDALLPQLDALAASFGYQPGTHE